MTPDDIFDSLLDFYQTQGADPSLILKDPTFNQLKVEDRLRLVKKHGKLLGSKISEGMTTSDAKTFGKDAVMGAAIGAGIGLQSILAYAGATGSNPKDHLPLVPIIALGGAGLAAISSGNKYIDRVAQRKEVKRALEYSQTSNKPASGVGPISTTHLQNNAGQNRFQTFLSQFGYGQGDYSRLKGLADGHFSQFSPY